MRKIDSLRAFDYSPWDEENVNLDEANSFETFWPCKAHKARRKTLPMPGFEPSTFRLLDISLDHSATEP